MYKGGVVLDATISLLLLLFDNLASLHFYKRRRLDQLGGKTENQAIREKMKYLIVDTVLERHTWRGTGEKKAFEKLTFLNDLLYKSVCSQFKNYTYKEFKSYMVQWLKHSKTRQRTLVYQYPNRNQEHENDEEHKEDVDNNH